MKIPGKLFFYTRNRYRYGIFRVDFFSEILIAACHLGQLAQIQTEFCGANHERIISGCALMFG
jgi:hypothetical protein